MQNTQCTNTPNMSWKKELARDFLGLSSWIFYIIVIARALIEPYRPFIDQMIIASVPIIILQIITKKPNYYAARIIPIATFTILFYNALNFTIFALAAGILTILAAHFVKKDTKEILYGLALGTIATLIGYYLPTPY